MTDDGMPRPKPMTGKIRDRPSGKKWPDHTRKFNPERREAFLKLLRKGGRRVASARSVGVSYGTIAHELRENPEFYEAVHLAEMEANEKVETALFDTALGGNVTAQQVWLYNRAPDRWADKRNVNTTVSANIRIEDARENLRAKLERLDEAITGEVIEALPNDSSSRDNGSTSSQD